MRRLLLSGLIVVTIALAACAKGEGTDSFGPGTAPPTQAGHVPDSVFDAAPPPNIHNVFLIVLSGHSWNTLKTNADAKYFNGTLVPSGAHAEQYYTPVGNHPGEPNLLWIEAGDSFGVRDDGDPSAHHQATNKHFTAQLESQGVAWKAYVEDIAGGTCPLTATSNYLPWTLPQIYFDDMTDGNTSTSKHCTDHIRPYTDFPTDLSKNQVGRFNYIVPNACHSMRGKAGSLCGSPSSPALVGLADAWLSTEVPAILRSTTFADGGLLIVAFDEGDPDSDHAEDGPLPFVVVASSVKKGYASSTQFTHGSLLRSLERVFQVQPFLAAADRANDIGEMFNAFP